MTQQDTVTIDSVSGYGSGSARLTLSDELSSLMDEAKTMWKVGRYHENIVNLQGITVNVHEGSIRQVNIIISIMNLFFVYQRSSNNDMI